MSEQKFINTTTQSWQNLEQFPGTQILPLAEPVPQGSIHRLRIKQGTVIPVHYHPCDEYVYVLEGFIETGVPSMTICRGISREFNPKAARTSNPPREWATIP